MLGGEAEHRENERGTGEQKCQNYESQSARALLQCFDFCCLMAQMILQSDFLCALKRGTEAYAEALGHSSLKSIFGPCSIRGGAGAGAVHCVGVPAPPGAVLLQQATLFFLGMWVLVFCCFFFFPIATVFKSLELHAYLKGLFLMGLGAVVCFLQKNSCRHLFVCLIIFFFFF